MPLVRVIVLAEQLYRAWTIHAPVTRTTVPDADMKSPVVISMVFDRLTAVLLTCRPRKALPGIAVHHDAVRSVLEQTRASAFETAAGGCRGESHQADETPQACSLPSAWRWTRRGPGYGRYCRQGGHSPVLGADTHGGMPVAAVLGKPADREAGTRDAA